MDLHMDTKHLVSGVRIVSGFLGDTFQLRHVEARVTWTSSSRMQVHLHGTNWHLSVCSGKNITQCEKRKWYSSVFSLSSASFSPSSIFGFCFHTLSFDIISPEVYKSLYFFLTSRQQLQGERVGPKIQLWFFFGKRDCQVDSWCGKALNTIPS